MQKFVVALWLVLILAVVGGFLKQVGSNVGVPNLIPLIRDPALLALAIWGISRLPIFRDKRWPLLLSLLIVFSAIYVVASMVEDRLLVGLYYLRIYLLPILFFLGMRGLLSVLPADAPQRLAQGLLRWNLMLLATAIALYVALQAMPRWRPALFGDELLPAAWYISGGTWMRMGLPAAGPNSLGIVLALNGFLILALLLAPRAAGPSGAWQPPAGRAWLLSSLLLGMVALLMTFSRSSLLVLLLGGPMLLMVSGQLSFQRMLQLIGGVLVLLGVLMVAGLIVDQVSDGYVTRWVELNAKGKDPSMIGHARSIEDAINKFDEYALVGYPRGTVGPKAIIFTGVVNNVENSLLGLLYDMGLPMSALYLLLIGVMLGSGYRHPAQGVLLICFGVPCLLLPYVFEADVLIYFSFVYLLLGAVLPPAQRGRVGAPATLSTGAA